MKARVRKSFTALGCHIYAGGFSIGVRDAGFRLLGHLEESEFGAETSRNNLGVPVWVGQENWGPVIEQHAGKVDWLYGNPPCSSWSSAGVKFGAVELERWKSHPLTKCTERLFGLVPQLRPKIFTWESVATAASRGRAFVEASSREMVAQGYNVHHVLVNAYDCGVPQIRKRFFFVASRVQLDFKAPDVTRITPRQAWKVITPRQAAASPAATLPAVYLDVLRDMPKNERKKLLHHYLEQRGLKRSDIKSGGEKVKGRPGFLLWRLSYDEPAPVVVGSAMLCHPKELRHISVIETQLLCGYPRDYVFAGSRTKQYLQIAKAVMPPVAKWLGKQVHRGLEAGVAVKVPAVTEHNFINGRHF